MFVFPVVYLFIFHLWSCLGAFFLFKCFVLYVPVVYVFVVLFCFVCLFVCLPEAQTHGLCGRSQREAVDAEALWPLARTHRCDDVET